MVFYEKLKEEGFVVDFYQFCMVVIDFYTSFNVEGMVKEYMQCQN
jgi:hypothetical protein